MMRVMHVITRMIIGGAQENTLFNCLDLKQIYGDDVLLVTGPADGPEGDLLQQGRGGDLAVKSIPDLKRAIHPARDYRAYQAIGRLIADFRPDVVHTHSAKGGMLGRRAAWANRVPAVLHTVHGAPFHPYQSALARQLFRGCEKVAATWCHRMISVADAMTDLMVDAGVAPRDKFVTIYSGMDVQPYLDAHLHRESIRQRYRFADDEIVVGKVARLFHLKGHDDLVTAAATVIKSNPKVRFLLVGDGILRQSLQARIDQLGLSGHFVFTGLVPPAEVPALMAAMDVLVHTSLREGLARALPQALIAGRPVVTYDIDGAREVAINDQTGYLVPPGNVAELASRIGQLAGDPAARARMGATGRQRFTDQFRHETMTRRIRETYQQVLDRV
jgi:glycosyltransferase involved in cell wall biosynthesis